jgi:hypothetical protein
VHVWFGPQVEALSRRKRGLTGAPADHVPTTVIVRFTVGMIALTVLT